MDEDFSSPHRAAVSPDNATSSSSPSPQKMAAKRDGDSSSVEPIQVGGEIETPAFALLDGVVYGKVSTQRSTRMFFEHIGAT
jgi:hypothetical protein